MKINEKNLIAYSTSRENSDKEGYLLKRVEINKIFERRWFVLKGNLLFYFEKKGDREPLGVIILEGCTTELAESEDYYVFKLIFHGSNSRVYELSAESQEELEAWMRYISRASYDYLKLMVDELEKQLKEIEGEENSSCGYPIASPMSFCSLPTSASHKVRENPFNRNEEVSFSDLWKCHEPLQKASSLLSKSPCSSGLGSIQVNPSLPLSIPFRPAPPPPILIAPSSKKSTRKKPFSLLHEEYGIQILIDRKDYTSAEMNFSCDALNTLDSLYEKGDLEHDHDDDDDVKTENLIDL